MDIWNRGVVSEEKEIWGKNGSEILKISVFCRACVDSCMCRHIDLKTGKIGISLNDQNQLK